MTPETKNSIITLRVTDAERAQLEAWAKAEDRSISGLIHHRLFRPVLKVFNEAGMRLPPATGNVPEDDSEF